MAFEGEEIVFDIIDGLVDRCGEVLYEHYLRKKQIPYATKNCLKDVFESLTTVYLDRDFGSKNPEVDSSWICEKEPVASQLDSWARGVVNVKKKPKKKPVQEEEDKPADVPVKKKKARRVGKDLMDEEDDRINQLIRAGTPGSPRGMMGGGGRQMTAKEEANLKELHDLEERENREKAKRQRIVDDALAEIKRSEKIMKDLKGKDYTFDHTGKVVMVHKAKGDKMKPMQQNVGVAVVNVQKEVLEAPPEKKKVMRRKKKKKKKPDVDPFKDSFLDTAPKQPSIMGDIYLAPGVNIAEGDSSKLGPNQVVVPDHMSRKDYNMLHQTLQETTVMGGGDGSGDESFEEGETEEQAEARRLNPADMGNVEMDPMVGAKLGGASGAPIPADDINLQLTGDPNWGSNVRVAGEDFQPSPIPAKPDDQKKQLTALMLGGEEVRNVRDRPHIVLSPTANRKKLPAPPLGHSTGHGHSAETFLPNITGGVSQMMVSKSVPFLTVKEKGRGGKMERSVENVQELLQ
jgi:hypothetical protein